MWHGLFWLIDRFLLHNDNTLHYSNKTYALEFTISLFFLALALAVSDLLVSKINRQNPEILSIVFCSSPSLLSWKIMQHLYYRLHCCRSTSLSPNFSSPQCSFVCQNFIFGRNTFCLTLILILILIVIVILLLFWLTWGKSKTSIIYLFYCVMKFCLFFVHFWIRDYHSRIAHA